MEIRQKRKGSFSQRWDHLAAATGRMPISCDGQRRHRPPQASVTHQGPGARPAASTKSAHAILAETIPAQTSPNPARAYRPLRRGTALTGFLGCRGWRIRTAAMGF